MRGFLIDGKDEKNLPMDKEGILSINGEDIPVYLSDLKFIGREKVRLVFTLTSTIEFSRKKEASNAV